MTTYVTTICAVASLTGLDAGTVYGELAVRVTRDRGDRWTPPSTEVEPLSLKVEGETVPMGQWWDVVMRLLEQETPPAPSEPEPEARDFEAYERELS